MSSAQSANSHCVRRIDVAIAKPFRKELSAVWLKKVAADALELALPEGEPGQLSLLVTDDETLRDLNRESRGVAELTAVLSVSPTPPGDWEEPPGARRAV